MNDVSSRASHTLDGAWHNSGMRNILKLSLIYFLLVFGCGFILGTIRTLWLLPHLSTRSAELIEIPIMLLVIFLSAKFVIKKLPSTTSNPKLILIGALALIYLLIAEFSLVLELRGISIQEYFTTRDPISGTAYFLSLIIYALMPYLLQKYSKTDRA